MQIALIAIGVIAGIAAVGYIRGAQLLMAPVQVVFLGLVAVLVPEGVRAAAHGAGTLRRLVAAVSGGELGLAVAWTLMVVIGFSVVGPLVLGSGWASFEPYVLPAAAYQMALVATAGPQMALRALGDARRSLRATISASVAGLVLPVALATNGAVAAAWGIALAAVIGIVIWWPMALIGIRAWQVGPGRTTHGATRTTLTPP